MIASFKPQMTTQSSFKEAESTLHGKFVGLGFDDKIAETVAHTFTHFMLGYVTAEGAARAIHDSGADVETARELAKAFEEARSAAKPVRPSEMVHE